MKPVLFFGLFVGIALCAIEVYGQESGFRIERSSVSARHSCRRGAFVCKAQGLRGIHCSTSNCRNCQIKKAGNGALDLYCNDGSNPNGYARCETRRGQVLCIA